MQPLFLRVLVLMNIYFKFAPFFGNWTTIDASELNFYKHENCFFSIAFIPSLNFKLLFRPHSSKFGKFLFIPFAYYSYDSYYSSTFCRLFALRRRLLVGPTSMKYINSKASSFELLLKMSRLTQYIQYLTIVYKVSLKMITTILLTFLQIDSRGI